MTYIFDENTSSHIVALLRHLQRDVTHTKTTMPLMPHPRDGKKKDFSEQNTNQTGTTLPLILPSEKQPEQQIIQQQIIGD